MLLNSRKMEVIYKIATFLLLSCFITGCANNPTIIKGYDEVKKQQICKLAPHLIVNEFGWFGRIRQTTISLNKASNGDIIGTFSVHTTGKKYASLSSKSNISFKITSQDGSVGVMKFKGFDHEYKFVQREIYTQFGSRMLPGSDSSISIRLTAEQLRKLTSDTKVDLSITTEKDPISTTLNVNDKHNLQEFLVQCI